MSVTSVVDGMMVPKLGTIKLGMFSQMCLVLVLWKSLEVALLPLIEKPLDALLQFQS